MLCIAVGGPVGLNNGVVNAVPSHWKRNCGKTLFIISCYLNLHISNENIDTKYNKITTNLHFYDQTIAKHLQYVSHALYGPRRTPIIRNLHVNLVETIMEIGRIQCILPYPTHKIPVGLAFFLKPRSTQ